MCGTPAAAVPAEAIATASFQSSTVQSSTVQSGTVQSNAAQAAPTQQLPFQAPPTHRPSHTQPPESGFESLFRPPDGQVNEHSRTQLIAPVEADYRMPPPSGPMDGTRTVDAFSAAPTQYVRPQPGNGYPPGAGSDDAQDWDDDEPSGIRKPVVWGTLGAVAAATAVILGLLYIGSHNNGSGPANGAATNSPTATVSTTSTVGSVDLAPGSASPSASASASASPSASAGGTSLPLSVGSTGPYVHYVQTRLRALGYYGGGITGQYDQATAQAVASFQARAGVTADPSGTVGKPTLTALIAAGSQPDLKFGQRSGDVRRLQEALNTAENAGLTISGHYDAATFAAVRRYQEQVGVAATGSTNQQTWTALQSGRVV